MCERSDARPDTPIDALWTWENDTAHSRQLLWEAFHAIREHGEDWDEVVFPSGTLVAHPVEIIARAGMHVEQVARKMMKRAEAWQKKYHIDCAPSAVPGGEAR